MSEIKRKESTRKNNRKYEQKRTHTWEIVGRTVNIAGMCPEAWTPVPRIVNFISFPFLKIWTESSRVESSRLESNPYYTPHTTHHTYEHAQLYPLRREREKTLQEVLWRRHSLQLYEFGWAHSLQSMQLGFHVLLRIITQHLKVYFVFNVWMCHVLMWKRIELSCNLTNKLINHCVKHSEHYRFEERHSQLLNRTLTCLWFEVNLSHHQRGEREREWVKIIISLLFNILQSKERVVFELEV